MALEKTSGYKNGSQFAKEVLAGLRASSLPLSKPVPLSFYLYVPTKKVARLCGLILEADGLEVEIRESASEDGTWLCLGHLTLKAEQKRLEQIGDTFVQLAGEYKGQFDGWETNPYKVEGGVEGLLHAMLKKLAAAN